MKAILFILLITKCYCEEIDETIMDINRIFTDKLLSLSLERTDNGYVCTSEEALELWHKQFDEGYKLAKKVAMRKLTKDRAISLLIGSAETLVNKKIGWTSTDEKLNNIDLDMYSTNLNYAKNLRLQINTWFNVVKERGYIDSVFDVVDYPYVANIRQYAVNYPNTFTLTTTNYVRVSSGGNIKPMN